MKKIQLSIPKPCDAAWGEMTPEDRGRFCGACQKTVVDFTAMSDRQLAAFFKKPKESVCGRFHNDQLQRAINIPRKRIPWIKYFFQVVWPTWMLFFASCGQRSKPDAGKVSMSADFKNHYDRYKVVGELQMAPFDSLPGLHFTPPVPAISDIDAETWTTMGITVPAIIEKVAPQQPPIAEPHIVAGANKEDTVVDGRALDTVMIASQPNIRDFVMGDIQTIAVCSFQTGRTDTVEGGSDISIALPKAKIFPNPVRRGGTVTIAASSAQEKPGLVQLFSGSGQLLLSAKPATGVETNIIHLSIPSNLTAGLYYLRLGDGATARTEKIIVQ